MSERVDIFSTLIPLMDPGSRLFIGNLLASILVILIFSRILGRRKFIKSMFHKKYWWNRSTKVDYQIFLINGFLKVFLLSPLLATSYFFSFQTLRALSHLFGAYGNLNGNGFYFAVATLFAFIWDDFLRFFHHRLMHKIPILWELHKTHHSARVLTPITLFRIHPLESVIATLRNSMSYGVSAGIFMFLFAGNVGLITLFGVNAFGFLFNMVGGNLRHSHIPLNYGWLEYLFISPKQHQLHHSVQSSHFDKNFGVCLSLWDQLFGSFLLSKDEELRGFGVDKSKAYCLKTQYAPDFSKLFGFANKWIVLRWEGVKNRSKNQDSMWVKG